jgi:hypothetical protein
VPHEALLDEAVQTAKDICSNDRDAVATLLTLYDDNAADQIASGLQREWTLAREWRDRVFSPETVGARRSGIRERGRDQIS